MSGSCLIGVVKTKWDPARRGLSALPLVGARERLAVICISAGPAHAHGCTRRHGRCQTLLTVLTRGTAMSPLFVWHFIVFKVKFTYVTAFELHNWAGQVLVYSEEPEADGWVKWLVLGLAVSVRAGHEGARASNPVQGASGLVHHGCTKRWVSSTVTIKRPHGFQKGQSFLSQFQK